MSLWKNWVIWWKTTKLGKVSLFHTAHHIAHFLRFPQMRNYSDLRINNHENAANKQAIQCRCTKLTMRISTNSQIKATYPYVGRLPPAARMTRWEIDNWIIPAYRPKRGRVAAALFIKLTPADDISVNNTGCVSQYVCIFDIGRYTKGWLDPICWDSVRCWWKCIIMCLVINGERERRFQNSDCRNHHDNRSSAIDLQNCLSSNYTALDGKLITPIAYPYLTGFEQCSIVDRQRIPEMNVATPIVFSIVGTVIWYFLTTKPETTWPTKAPGTLTVPVKYCISICI